VSVVDNAVSGVRPWARVAGRVRPWFLPVVTLVAVPVALGSAAFSVRIPSLNDDWFGIAYGGRAFHALLHGAYVAEGADYAGRYRPGYAAIWNYIQWHLLGAPSVTKAGLWGLLRIALFLYAAWLVAGAVRDRRTQPGKSAAILWLAPLALAATPAVGLDLARHGPAEPTMVAGIVVGLSAVAGGVARMRRAQTLAVGPLLLIGAGYVTYLFGVYSKEPSICLLVFLPFLAMWLRASGVGWWPTSGRRRVALATLSALLVAPLIHVGVHFAGAVVGGQRPYPTGELHLGLGTKLFAAGISPLLGLPGALGTWLWLLGAPAAILLTVAAARRREPDAWLLAGVLLTGYLMSAMSLARGPTPSWYYIPWLVAVAAVCVRGLSFARPALQIAVATLVLVPGAVATTSKIHDWTATERSGATATEMAKGVATAGCPLYLSNFDIEQRLAVPTLLRFAHGDPIPGCSRREAAYVVSWRSATLPSAFAARCVSGWRQVGARDDVWLLSCGVFSGRGVVDQFDASGQPLVTAVRVATERPLPAAADLLQPPVRHPAAAN
jgi:hypothetical protein